MLREIRVRDLALVASATVRFGPGLNLLTGETGSGKSLIVDALGLTLGGRASGDQVREGAEGAEVETIFEPAGGPALVLKREIGRRGNARVNGRPATPAQLKEVARSLVGMHGQHEHHALLDPDAQTQLLDAYAGGLALRDEVARLHREWKAAEQRLGDLERVQARGRREEEYLRWQLEELRSANLRPGEDAELVAERSVARHSVRLAELTERALDAIHGGGLGDALAAVEGAADLDPRLRALADRLQLIEEEIGDAAGELRRYGEAIDHDPQRLESVEARLAQLEMIRRKYGGSLEAALAEQARLESQLGQGEDLEEAVEAARRLRDTSRGELERSAGELTEVRRAAGVRLAEAVSAELAGLRLEGARVEIELRPQEEIGPAGAEAVEIMFSANPREPLRPLARVASGGELSRVMLAIKTAGAESDRLPTLVFDEVDAGIGGEAALRVGQRLKALGATRQVLVVTHLAQIACFADHHLVVRKDPDPAGRNVVNVRELSSLEERAAELARMMSGGITEKALARARELLLEAGA